MDRRGENTPHATRRALLKSALAAGGLGGVAASSPGMPVMALAQQTPREGKSEPGSPALALALARLFNRTKFSDLPPVAIKHAKIILASTLASAAPGSLIGSARIIRDLAKEQGGQPESTIWYDGTKLPVTEAARVNAMFSDAAASDDSDLRNVAHTGTSLAAIGLALGERTGATGPDVLCAIVTGYEAAGRGGAPLRGAAGSPLQ